CDDISDQPLCRADARNTMSVVRPPAGPKSSKTPFRHPSCILLRSAPPLHGARSRQTAAGTSTEVFAMQPHCPVAGSGGRVGEAVAEDGGDVEQEGRLVVAEVVGDGLGHAEYTA